MPFLQLRYSLRSLVRDPVFVAVVVLVLSLGIAANTTIFTVIDQIVLNPLPYRDPDRLVMVWESNPSLSEPAGSRVPAAWYNLAEWRNQSQSFEAIEGFAQAGFNLTGLGSPEHLTAARATGAYFQMLGASTKRGRTLLPEDTRPGAARVVVVTDAFANRHFAGSDAVGQKILLDGVPHAIVGVLPRSFHLPLFLQGAYEYKPDVWVATPEINASDPPSASKTRRFFTFARLKDGKSLAQARSEMIMIASRLARNEPTLNTGYSVNLVPLKVENADPDLDHALRLIWAAALVLLLLGCANLGSLTLVRAANKQRDLAIMGALGAPRSALIATILRESVVLTLVAGTLAVLASYAGVGAIRELQPGDIPGTDRLRLEWPGFVFAAAVFTICVLAFGWLPAWLSTRHSLNSSLKTGTWNSRTGSFMRRLLACAQVAIAVTLALGAMLLVRSFQKILQVDPGYQTQNVLTAHIALNPPRYGTPDEKRRFCDGLLTSLHQLPGVEAVSLADNFPLYSIRYTFFEIEGRPVMQPASLASGDYANVSADFFQTMGTPLRRGRFFTSADLEEDTENVAIVNESMAHKFWATEDPIGGHIRFVAPPRQPGPWRRVVGVVADFRQFNIDTPARPEMFWPARQFTEMTLAVRTTTNPTTALQSLQGAVSEIDKEVALSDMQTLQQMVNHSISQRRFNMLLLSGFAGLSILLAFAGIYGLVSYIVASRIRDIAVRLTLGAQRKHVLFSLLLGILPYAGAGVVAGLLLSLLATKIMSGLLFGISRLDQLTYIILPLMSVILVLLAALFPALRAARIEPVVVLRRE